MQLSFRQVMLVLISTIGFAACKKEESFEKGLRSFEYDLTEVEGSGFSGKVLFTENIDSSFNVLVTLNNSLLGTIHDVNIYNGSLDSSIGSVAIPLNPINGNGVAAQSETRDVREASLPDGLVVPLTYDGILAFPGYVGVSSGDSLVSWVQL